MEKRIQKELIEAMKAKDGVRLKALRNIKTAFTIEKTSPGHSGDLTDEEALKVIQKLSKQSADSIEQYTDAGRKDLADKEKAELEVIKEFLPKQLSEEEVEKVVSDVISEVAANSMKDMGKVMKSCTEKLSGRADGKTISNIVRKLLNNK